MKPHPGEQDSKRINECATSPSDGGSLIERSVAFSRALRAKSHPERGQAADKAFIDSLYEA